MKLFYLLFSLRSASSGRRSCESINSVIQMIKEFVPKMLIHILMPTSNRLLISSSFEPQFIGSAVLTTVIFHRKLWRNFTRLELSPRLWGRSMARSSQSVHRQKRNTFMFVIRDFMPSTWWQSVMQKCGSQTLWPSGMAQSMTQPSSTGAHCRFTWKRNSRKDGCLGTEDTPYRATLWPP